MTIRRLTTAVAGAAVLALTLAACGGDEDTAGSQTSTPSASSTADGEAVSDVHNDADVTFAQMMIVHHRGAVDMAEMADGRAESPEVQELADAIAAAQGPEIETMSGWLETWGEEVPEDMGGMDHGGMDMGSMPGMMTEEQMAALEAASGPAFDRMFLEMMTEHHQGAITMAQTEQSDGENPEAVELAGTIEADQTAEIEQMRELLTTL